MIGPNCLGIASTATPPECARSPVAPYLRAACVLVTERRARPGVARRRRRRGPRPSPVRLDRQQGRCFLERPARVLGGRRATDLIFLYLESFGNPQKFARVAGRVARSKPILAMRSGTSRAGARAASSHTAALGRLGRGRRCALLAGRRPSRLDARGATRRCGAVLVAAAAARQPRCGPDERRRPRDPLRGRVRRRGTRVAAACRGDEARAPSRDPGRGEPCESRRPARAPRQRRPYEAALPALLADPGIDAVIALFVPPVVATADDVAAAIARVAKDADKPVLPVVMSADGAPPGAFAYPESAARALGLAARRAAWLRRPAGDLRTSSASIETRPRRSSPTRSRSPTTCGSSRAKSVHCSRRMDCHWSQSGTQRHPRRRRRRLRRWASRSSSRPPRPAPTRRNRAASTWTCVTGRVSLRPLRRSAAPLSSRPYVTEGAELLAGALQDPVFGPLVAFGPGGVFAELIGSTRLALAPLTDVDAAELVASGKAGRLVAGWRGAPPADAAALADVLHRLARLVEQHPEVAELDLNPVLAGPERCVAVDARVRLTRRSRPRPLKTW